MLCNHKKKKEKTKKTVLNDCVYVEKCMSKKSIQKIESKAIILTIQSKQKNQKLKILQSLRKTISTW